LEKVETPLELLETLTVLQKRLETLINLTPTSSKRNKLTEENIRALQLINSYKP